MDIIKFNKNWNQKLCCDNYTTIRLHSNKFFVGNVLETVCKIKDENRNTEIREKAKVVFVKSYRLNEIPEEVFWTDCGLSKQHAIEMIEKMYSKYDIHIHSAKWDVVVLQHVY